KRSGIIGLWPACVVTATKGRILPVLIPKPANSHGSLIRAATRGIAISVGRGQFWSVEPPLAGPPSTFWQLTTRSPLRRAESSSLKDFFQVKQQDKRKPTKGQSWSTESLFF